MHVARVAIENFRNFSSIDIDDLPAGLVLFGENGSGKSNFLHALRLVLDPSLPETARRLGPDDFWDGLDAPFCGNEIKVVVELAGFDDDSAAKAVLGDFLVATTPHRARLTFRFGPVANTEDPSQSQEPDYEVVVFGGSNEIYRVGRSEWKYVSLRLLPALRDAEALLRSSRSPLRRLIDRSPVDNAVLVDTAAKIDEAAKSLTETGELGSIAAAISSRLEDMVGDLFGVETSLGVTSTKPDQLLRSLKLFIDSEGRRGVEQASLGTANLLYVTLLLEDLGAQRAAGDIVEMILGVEEPEAHLHPHVQRVLFRHLLSGDRALVVTTHSPQIASVTPLESLALLRICDGESRAFRATDIDLTPIQKADIERYLDVTRAEMLFARVVILVEGLAELYVVPAFAQNVGLDLDALGVTVCSVHGTDFAPYVRFLSTAGLDIPSVVITDGDPNKQAKPMGIVRAIKLLDDDRAGLVTLALEDEDYALARGLCESGGIIVGDHTLEIDLIATAKDAMCEAYDELVAGVKKRQRFREEIGLALSESQQRTKLLRRIEAVGKGRYAQRLAGHLSGVEAPAYIASALELVRQLTEDTSDADEPDG